MRIKKKNNLDDVDLQLRRRQSDGRGLHNILEYACRVFLPDLSETLQYKVCITFDYCHFQVSIYTPFKWRFADGPIVVYIDCCR